MTIRGFAAIAVSATAIAAACAAPVAGETVPTGSSPPAEHAFNITPEIARRVTVEIVPEIEAMRGLTFKKTVPVEVIDDDQARTYMLARLKHFEMDRQMRVTGEAFTLLGLLPGKVDMIAAVLDVMREQAGGFYDPVAEVFYLLEDMPVALAPMITAHELTHALEDQYFDLDARLESALDDDDRLFALSAVHEGSAMVLMSLFTARQIVDRSVDPAELERQATAQETRQEALQGLPPVLLRQLMGPYVLGAGFLARGSLMHAMTTGFPVEDVGRVYASGPLSSEQILHPEKYWDAGQRDDPREVTIRGIGEVLGPRWQRNARGVLGELSLGVLVGASTPAQDAAMMTHPAASWTNAAAAGWGGDRWELWKRGGAAVAVAAIEWDTEADAQEFVDALPERDGVALARSGARLVLVAGKTGKKKDALLAAALDGGGDVVVPSAGKR